MCQRLQIFFALMEMLYVCKSVHCLYPSTVLVTSKQASTSATTLIIYPLGLRYFAVEAVCSTFDVILVTNQAIIDGEDRMKATEATGILSQVQTF